MNPRFHPESQARPAARAAIRRFAAGTLLAVATLGVHGRAALPQPGDAGGSMPHDNAIAASAAETAASPMLLPETVGAWHRGGDVRLVGPEGIFDVMDGAGELYLAYRFERLEIAEYHAAAGDILVEVYRMGNTDDAFGLLSTDWGGEPVGAAGGKWPTALYGAGLLRLRAGPLYARVLATRESPAAREAVLALGASIADGRTAGSAPDIVASLPAAPLPGITLRRDSVCFLRSHLVLNSAYFLSQRDVLDLGRDVDAVTARYDGGTGDTRHQVRLIAVHYPDARRAAQARARFLAAYLPEIRPGSDELAATRTEHGWAATGLSERTLAIALDAPDRETAARVVTATLAALAPPRRHR